MSVSQVFYPIVSALVAAEEVLGPNRCWSPKNPQQAEFLEDVFSQIRGEVGDIPELTSGYKFDDSKLELTIFGTLDLLVKWLREGSKIIIQRAGEDYEGVRLGVEGAGVRFFKADFHPYPIVQIPTRSEKDFVYLTIWGKPADPDPAELTAYAGTLLEKLAPFYRSGGIGYGGVCFPMVDLKHDNDVRWFVGMETTNKSGLPVAVTQASQETKLRMNEKGAHLKSTFRGTLVITSAALPEPDYIIDQPFLVIFVREGLSLPLGVLYITEEDWKNPGTLDFPD